MGKMCLVNKVFLKEVFKTTMNIFLWVLQVLLALFFIMVGFTKGFSPLAEMVARVPWVADTPSWVPRLAGISEILGGVGLILPAATKIKPMLTPLAAAMLGLVMFLAIIFHLVRGEFGTLPINLIALVLAGFVAYGRARLSPIAPREK